MSGAHKTRLALGCDLAGFVALSAHAQGFCERRLIFFVAVFPRLAGKQTLGADHRLEGFHHRAR